MNRANEMIQREVYHQKRKWGFEHDLENHGSQGLIEAAMILISPNDPDLNDEWFIQLRKKYKDNPTRRYAIAAALLHAAIDCKIYEQGLKI